MDSILSQIVDLLNKVSVAVSLLTHPCVLSGELTKTIIIFSRKLKNNSQAAKEWRNEIAYYSLLLLRTMVAVIEYELEQIAAWEVPEHSGFELEYVMPKDAWHHHT